MSKKIIYLLSLLMALSLVFASCKKNSGLDPNSSGFQPEEDQDNTGGVVDGSTGLVTDFDKLPTDKVIFKGTVFEGNGRDYLRNPVIVVMGEQSNTVVVFGERRYKSPGAANDVGINGTDAVDVIYKVSDNAGTRFEAESYVNQGNKPTTEAAKSHGAPVVFKVNATTVVVVASAGGGIARTSTEAVKGSFEDSKKPASKIEYIVGQLSGKTMSWSDWKSIDNGGNELLTKIQSISTPNSSFTYTQMGTHSAKGQVAISGSKATLILPVVMAQQGTTSSPKEMMGVYFVTGTIDNTSGFGTSGTVTWNINDGGNIPFAQGNGNFSKFKEARVISGASVDDVKYIAVPNPGYGNDKYALGSGKTAQPDPSGITGHFGSPGYLSVKWYGKGTYEPAKYDNGTPDRSVFMAVNGPGQNQNLRIFMVGKDALNITGKTAGYLVHETGKSASVDVLGDGTIVTAGEEGLRDGYTDDRDFVTKFTRYSQSYLSSLIEN